MGPPPPPPRPAPPPPRPAPPPPPPPPPPHGSFDTAEPRLATIALLSSGIDIARWYHDGGDITPEAIGAYYADLALRTVGATRET